MLFSDDPSKSEFYQAESEYGKLVLRRASKHDLHVYKLLTARLMLDSGQLRTFFKQDSRLVGQHSERCNMYSLQANNRLVDLANKLNEGTSHEEDIDKIAQLLATEEKR